MKQKPLSCDFGDAAGKKAVNRTRLHKFQDTFAWKGIKAEKYKPAGKDWADIVRNTLIGNQGESTKFHLRYFEIAPGGYSSLEWHKHEHVVIGIRGRGLCVAGKKRYQIGFLDTLYIEPKLPHQLRNPFDEPFGFFCIVNAKRDRPKILATD